MPAIDAYQPILLDGRAGRVEARWYPAAGARAAAILFGGMSDGFETPAGQLYVRLGRHLPQDGVAVLRVRFREPGDLPACVADVLAGVEWLVPQGLWHVGLVGHSFGGAIAIAAAVERPAFVGAVVALGTTRSFGTDAVSRLRESPLLLVHGTDDEVYRLTYGWLVEHLVGAAAAAHP